MRAVCLLSGGMDSAVSIAVAIKRGFDVYPLTFQYNQKNIRELDSAKKLVRYFALPQHKIFNIDLKQIGGSALTDNIEVPTGKSPEEIRRRGEIPITYVPARNTIFLSIALAYAEVVDADSIFIGVNSIDSSGYPDCRPEYLKRFQALSDVATKKTMEDKPIGIQAPLLEMTKADIVRKGMQLGVPFQLTWSCYKKGEKACGVCDSCILRLNGFKEAGYEDPLEYER
ncbi:MAG: 7-cyano-7-deazaguanine synthase QueC [Candidatus Altiarchaeota archaeon]|nr:7-cyano-7-deazaguanine synthase QueC [Candidatus Altiarchaeota archaeon]